MLLELAGAPWSIDRTVLEWWDNPVANLPVPDEAVPEVARRCRLSVGPDGVEDLTVTGPDRTPGVLLTDEAVDGGRALLVTPEQT